MGRLLGWPVRAMVIALLALSLIVDGAGTVLPSNLGGWQIADHLGLDLAGGTSVQLGMSGFPPGQDRAQVQQRTIDVLQARVNALGVSEPLIQPAGGAAHDRIELELPGISGAEAQKLIGQRYQLVITRWVADPSITSAPFPGYRPQLTPMTSDMLTSAVAELDPSGSNTWVVTLDFNSTGAGIYSQLTQATYDATCPQPGTVACPERSLSAWVDLTPDDIAHWSDRGSTLSQSYAGGHGAKLLFDAYTKSPIPNGQAVIQGDFTQQSARELATGLNNAALPVTLEMQQMSSVSATLGASSVRSSLAAGLLGLSIVVVFMGTYYRLPGVLAGVALLCYAGIVLAVFRMFAFTLTLAGLAGFILSVGMAVDANVLIFERLKEELRAGRTWAAAVDMAVGRAWPAIRDSNVSTLITSTVLIFAAPQQLKGFAITLAIGVVVSLISSIVITHNLLALTRLR